MYINGHGCVPAKKYLHKREWAGFGQLSGVNQLLTESIELKRVMGERLSKALGTSQRKTSFTKWLMEIWKAVYTGGWGDGGEVTEGLIRHRPPCQALPTLRSFSESDLNVSISRPSSTCRGSSQGQPGKLLPFMELLLCQACKALPGPALPHPSLFSSHSPPTESLTIPVVPTSTIPLLPLPGRRSPPHPPAEGSPRGPAELLLLVQTWPSPCPWRRAGHSLLGLSFLLPDTYLSSSASREDMEFSAHKPLLSVGLTPTPDPGLPHRGVQELFVE